MASNSPILDVSIIIHTVRNNIFSPCSIYLHIFLDNYNISARIIIIFQLADLSMLEKQVYHDITVHGVLVVVSNKYKDFIKVCLFIATYVTIHMT